MAKYLAEKNFGEERPDQKSSSSTDLEGKGRRVEKTTEEDVWVGDTAETFI